jgi:hypothetical protein
VTNELEIQKKHAFKRGKEQYGLYLEDVLYNDLNVMLRSATQKHSEGWKASLADMVRFVDENERYGLWRVFFLDEWTGIVFDKTTRQVASFVPNTQKKLRTEVL